MGKISSLIFSAGLIMFTVVSAHAQTAVSTSFTYQGELANGGVPATGVYDIRFRLYDAAAAGNQVGTTLCSDNLDIASGRFAATLDFGAQFAGQKRFLEIDVRLDTGLGCADGTGYTTLVPRQELSGTPNAIFSLNAAAATTAATATSAANAAQLGGQAPSFYQNAANLSSGVLASGRLGGTYSGALNFTNASNAFSGSYSGSGAGLTLLNATNLNSGTVADARLSGNVALLSGVQTFTGAKTFSTAPNFSAAGAPFSIAGSGLVNNLNADLLDGLSSAAFLQAIPNPLSLTGSSATHIIRGENAASSLNAAGVIGSATATTGSTYGGRFESSSTSGTGVLGSSSGVTGTTYGVYGISASSAGTGVAGWAIGSSGLTFGVAGISASTGGHGVYGFASGASGTTYGVRGEASSASGFGGYFSSPGVALRAQSVGGDAIVGTTGAANRSGVYATNTAASGAAYGVAAAVNSPSGRGVYGEALAISGDARGGEFYTASPDGYGVTGFAGATTGSNFGVWGGSNSTTGTGVYGEATSTAGINYGVHGVSRSNNGSAAGVYGESITNFGNSGVFGRSFTGNGVRGWASGPVGSGRGGDFSSSNDEGYGVYADALAVGGLGSIYGVYGKVLRTGATAYGVWAEGRLGASGTKSFRIDHPADPANKYLLHYSAESPEVINFYSGKVELDGVGEAVVEMPAYFARINKDPRYTLTAIGAPMPMLHVAEEIDETALSAGALLAPEETAPKISFRIAGGAPGAKVSWRVDAVRNDKWMQNAGAAVEVEKQGKDKGTYQYPEWYGKPAEMGVNHSAGGR